MNAPLHEPSAEGGGAGVSRLLGMKNGHDGLEEAAVFLESGLIVGSEGGLHGFARGGSDQLEATDEDADNLRGRRVDGERKDGVHIGARNDVEEAAALFEPGIV